VVDLAHIACFDYQPDLGPGLLPDQMVMDRGGEEQRRDGSPGRVGVAVREHHDASAIGNRHRHLETDLVQPLGQLGAATGDPEEPTHDMGAVPGQVTVAVDVDDLRQAVVVDDREWQYDLPA
jgi:hypothetical protein